MNGADDFQVEVMPPARLGEVERAAWQHLRAQHPLLWSPFFDIRYIDVIARHAPNPNVAVIHRHGTIIGFLPFQGRSGGVCRPLGAPMADHHGIVAAEADVPCLSTVCRKAGIDVFPFTGLVTASSRDAPLEADEVWIADTSSGAQAWSEHQRALWKDHARKMERRLRKAAEDHGPVSLQAGLRDQRLMEPLTRWKATKYRATGRHNIMGVRWIRAFLDDLLTGTDPGFGGELSVLRFGDKVAAIEFGMRGGRVLHSWFPAYDDVYAAASPGVALMEGMIRAAASRGIDKVDLGTGHAQYKKYCADASFTVFRGTVRSPGLRAKVAKGVEVLSHRIESAGSLGPLSRLPGKVGRRLEQILAAEPTIAGRLRGMLWAAVSMGSASRG
jgi:CelD/BcsL family acetyltransferase involved in cellulose biosynthesis